MKVYLTGLGGANLIRPSRRTVSPRRASLRPVASELVPFRSSQRELGKFSSADRLKRAVCGGNYRTTGCALGGACPL